MMKSQNPMSPAAPAFRARQGQLFRAAALAVALAVPAGMAVADPAPAPAEPPPAKAAEAPAAKPALPALALEGLPADVYSVTLVGRWSDKRESGVYRMIVVKGGSDELMTRVVVQWIRVKAGEKPVVVASREIEAFNQYIGMAMVPTWRDLSPNRLQVMADVRLPDGQRKRVRVLAATPGELSDPV
jgi:hypothetical protein